MSKIYKSLKKWPSTMTRRDDEFSDGKSVQVRKYKRFDSLFCVSGDDILFFALGISVGLCDCVFFLIVGITGVFFFFFDLESALENDRLRGCYIFCAFSLTDVMWYFSL